MRSKVSNNLGAERGRRGWTQAHVAGLGGISRQSYSAIESGDAVPSTEVALRLASAFDLPVEQLFQLESGPTPRLMALAVGRAAAVGQRVRLVRVGGRRLAYATGDAERPFAPVDGVVRRLKGGNEVEVALLPDRPTEADLMVVGCDPAFGLVAERMRRERGLHVAWTQRGSRAALEALAGGEAHVAGAHLGDAAGGDDNARWIRELIPFPCTRVVFAVWEQGILVGPGNPLGIGGVADLARPELRFLNREPGSGSRALLDERLRAAGVPEGRIRGYETGARGHMAVAEAIAAGLADAGIGIRAAGGAHGLDLVPLRSERYELVVPNHYLDLPAVQVLLEVLGRSGIRAQVEALGGYDTSGMGESV